MGLEQIPDLTERITEGEIVPSGECPKCGALCHAVTATEEEEDNVFGCTCGEEIPLSDKDEIDEHIATCNGEPKEDDDSFQCKLCGEDVDWADRSEHALNCEGTSDQTK